MLLPISLAFATLLSEDLACVTAGLLIQRGELDVVSGILACAAGIFVGDVGLWAVGRAFGRAATTWPWLGRRLEDRRSRHLRLWLDRHAAGAIVGSRFLPGARLTLYVLAGILKLPARVFAAWTLIATLLWTPTIVLLTASLGDTFVSRFSSLMGLGWAPQVLAVAAVLLLLRGARAFATSSLRVRMTARLARWSRWEFWPMWLFYGPVAACVALLAVRYRGLSTITAANPGMQDGGTVGESKWEILARLPAECTIPSALIPTGTTWQRAQQLGALIQEMGWSFPLVLKPDVGLRGLGVKLARTADDAEQYLSRVADPVLVQPYHEGPCEAGIFYYRMPGWTHGHILSITDKHFPFVVGDGTSTLSDLIWSHARYRMQAATFTHRHREALRRVLAPGETFQLAIAGNHAQGTLFRDGRHLLTPALERRIDDIAQAFPGFYVGRFDVRYRDVDEFKAGRDLAIVELNGATAESTNIYDPTWTLREAYRQLFRQWSIVFAIGAANRARGARASSHRRLFELLRAHFNAPCVFPVSD